MFASCIQNLCVCVCVSVSVCVCVYLMTPACQHYMYTKQIDVKLHHTVSACGPPSTVDLLSQPLEGVPDVPSPIVLQRSPQDQAVQWAGLSGL